MEKIPCRYVFQKKVRNASEKHLNGEISIQNGDFSILNGENSLLRFFSKKCSKRFWKRMNGEISIQNGDFSILNGEEWIICVFLFISDLPGQKKYWKIISIQKKNKRFSTTFEVKNASFFEKTDAKRFSKKSEWRFLHSEWRFLRSNFSEAFSTFFLKILCKLFSRNFSPFRMEKSPFRMEKYPFTFFEKRFHHFFFAKYEMQLKNASKK